MPNSTATSINIETKLAPGIEQANGAGVPKRRHWPATLAAYLLWQIAALLVVEGLLAVAGLERKNFSGLIVNWAQCT